MLGGNGARSRFVWFLRRLGFIPAVTVLKVANGTLSQIDPARSDPGSDQISAYRVLSMGTPLPWLRNPC